MPSLLRFLASLALAAAIGYGAIYVLANNFEPQPREIVTPVPAVKVRR